MTHTVKGFGIVNKAEIDVPGSSPGGSREFEGWTALAWKNLFIYECKIRLGNYSVVGRLSGGRGLNSLVYAEDQ